MAKKIKKNTKTKEEREAEKAAALLEKQRQAAGIEDEFQARGKELVLEARKKQGLVIGALLAVVVGGLVLGIMSYMNNARDEKASGLFAVALESYEGAIGDPIEGAKDKGPRFATEKERAEKARELFAKVVATEASSGVASLAQLYIGRTSMDLGEFDKALTAYRAFMSKISSTDALYFAGPDGEIAALEGKGDKAAALAALEKRVAANYKVAQDASLLSLARMYKAKGDKDKAKETLTKLTTDFPESLLKPEAEQLLATL